MSHLKIYNTWYVCQVISQQKVSIKYIFPKYTYTFLVIHRVGQFETMPGLLCYVLSQDTLLSQCLRTTSNLMLGVSLRYSLSFHATESGGERRPDEPLVSNADFTFDYLLYCTINITKSNRHFFH